MRASTAEEADLPEGWVEKFDAKRNKPYYVNAELRKTTWIRPNGGGSTGTEPRVVEEGTSALESSDASVKDSLPDLAEGWVEKFDAKKQKSYYVNATLRKTQWIKPVSARAASVATETAFVEHATNKWSTAEEEAGLPEGWIAKFDLKRGKPYYINAALRKTQWTRPTVVAGVVVDGRLLGIVRKQEQIIALQDVELKQLREERRKQDEVNDKALQHLIIGTRSSAVAVAAKAGAAEAEVMTTASAFTAMVADEAAVAIAAPIVAARASRRAPLARSNDERGGSGGNDDDNDGDDDAQTVGAAALTQRGIEDGAMYAAFCSYSQSLIEENLGLVAEVEQLHREVERLAGLLARTTLSESDHSPRDSASAESAESAVMTTTRGALATES